ncbi:hypothetical protein [Gymnodinialimonas ulvae]
MRLWVSSCNGAISSMAGNDHETEIALVRGQLQAVDRRVASRGCAA